MNRWKYVAKSDHTEDESYLLDLTLDAISSDKRSVNPETSKYIHSMVWHSHEGHPFVNMHGILTGCRHGR